MFIPLISIYGLRVCPVLSIPGFGFGCYYSGVYIFSVNLINLSTLFLAKKMNSNVWRDLISKRNFVFTMLVYILSTIFALISLNALLSFSHLSEQSRAPEILLIASLLLGIFQGYGLNWANFNSPDSGEKNTVEVNYNKQWVEQIFRIVFPMILVGAIAIHFIVSQSVDFNEGRTAPLVNHDEFIKHTSYLLIFLLAWLCLTMLFHFLSERDLAKKFNLHIQELEKSNFNFRSDNSKTWGLWSILIEQLNSFSKVLAEKNRLIRSFSKFVTAEVVQQALISEVKNVKGTMKELTVIMTDIRGFTSISESLTPEQVVILLNEYFTVMLDVTASFQITVDKFIGDGFLAYVDIENSDSVQENKIAVEAALEMLKRLEDVNLRLSSLKLPHLKIGIGIFRGPLVIGLIGSEAKLQHTIIGDTVNKTARLENMSKELDVSVVISGHIWHALAPEMQRRFKSYGKKTLKGIKDGLEVFGGPC